MQRVDHGTNYGTSRPILCKLLTFPNKWRRDELRHPSVARDHDLTEMAAALEMTIGLLCFGERKCPIDHGAQAMQSDGSVHRLEIGAAPDADRAYSDAAAGQQ